MDEESEEELFDVDYLAGICDAAVERKSRIESSVPYVDHLAHLEMILAPAPKRRKVFNAPSQRGPADHHGICARMREAKETKRRRQLQAKLQKMTPASQPLGRRRRKCITGQLVVSVCQDAVQVSNESRGKLYSVSARTARRCLEAGAYARLLKQDHQLRMLDRDDLTIHFATSSMAWDGTEQKLRMPDFGMRNSFLKKARGTLKVMVSVENLGIGLTDGANVVMRLIRPCVAMLSSTTMATYNALFRMRSLKEIELTRSMLVMKAKIMDYHFDTDGDCVNFGIIDARRGFLRDVESKRSMAATITSTAMTCGNHRTCLCDGAVVDMLGSRFTMGASHRYALLLRMGPNLIRLHSACRPVLASTVRRFPENERPEPHPFNVELVDYLLAVYVGTTKSSTGNGKKVSSSSPMSTNIEVEVPNGPRWARTEAGQWYKAFLCNLLRIFPAPWYHGLRLYGADSMDIAVQLMQQLCCQKLVSVPSAGKWFKTGPCVDSLISQSCLGVFVPLLQEAFKNKKPLVTEFTCTVGDVAYIEEVSWQQVRSSRIEQTISWGTHDEFHFIISTWAILKEPQRQIHMEFIIASSENCKKELIRPNLRFRNSQKVRHFAGARLLHVVGH